MPDITAQAPDGSKHVFPDGTDPAIIDRTMKTYITGGATQTPTFAPGSMAPGSYQTRPGGPVLNTSDSPFRTGALAAERGLGINNPTSLMDAFSQALSSLGGQAKQSFESWRKGLGGDEPMEKYLPTATVGAAAMTPIDLLAKGVEGVSGSLESSIKDITQGWNRKDPRSVAAGIGEFLPAKAATVEGPDVRGGLREVMGEGASKARVLGDMHAHAIETQKHIAGVAEQVHTDAQQAMARVSQAVDAAKPEGAFDKVEVRDRIKSAMGDTLSDESQLPSSLKKLTTPEKPTFAGFVNKNTQGLISRLRDGGLSDSEIGDALKQQGFRPDEVKAALSESAGTQPGRMTFEEVKQARSDLGRQLGRVQGPAGAAASSAYGELSKILREGARDAKVEPDWIDANARYKNYVDDFVRSPLSKTLEGENATDIMDPLTGKSRAQVMGILGKYTPFGMDMERIGQEVNRSGVGETVMKLSRPSKFDLLMAGFSPKALALRQLGPRIFRNPKAISLVTGKGFEPADIKPSQVFPSKAAAMKAGKEPTSGAEPSRKLVARNVKVDPATGKITASVDYDERAKNRVIGDAIIDQLYGDLRRATKPEDKARIQRNIDDLKEQ